MRHHRQSRGFTLVEILVAAALALLVVTGAFATFINGLRSWQAETVKNEINIDLVGAMEKIRHDLRLSSLSSGGINMMAFYPVNAAQYTAISFPMSTPDANGLIQRDPVTGKITWNQTVIYHVLSGTPNKLLRTVFSPRYTNATPGQLYSQLLSVVGGTNTCLSGEGVSTQVVFQNLVNLRIRPPTIQFDGYAPTYCKADTFNWGSVVLSNGVHNLTFTIQGKNTNSTGYKVGFDSFSLSQSSSPREGEIYLRTNSHPRSPYYSYALSGGSVTDQNMSAYGAAWSGNSQLTYNGAAISNSITFVVQNDLWCDANFDNPPGLVVNNVSRKTDTSFITMDPAAGIPDIVISMDQGTNWTADGCTQESISSIAVSNTSPAVVNVIYGGTNPAAAITMNGEWVRVQFTAGTNGSLYVKNASISQQSSGITPVAGTTASLNFYSSDHYQISAGTSFMSDWVPNYVIDRTKNYLVQFDLQTGSDNQAKAWVNNTVPFMSTMGGIQNNMIIGVSALEVRYPSNGVYRSGIFDTHTAPLSYHNLNWTGVQPDPDGTLGLKVRSGNAPDLSDAGAWQPFGGYFPANTANNIAGLPLGRYVQYEALFKSGLTGAHTNTAILRDVTIDWNVPTGLVDLQIDFAKGPDYGVVSATVDGQSLVKGLEIEMEIFKNGPYGTNTAKGIMEVRPLNTNK